MKLATFQQAERTALGIVTADGLIDLERADARLPRSMRALLEAGPEAIAQVHRYAAIATERLPLTGVRLAAPIPDPRKFLGLGFSYRSHVAEIREHRKDIKIPANQVWFTKQVSCVNGPFDDIHKPPISDMLDYEGEMAVVIGRRCRHVKPSRAHEVIAGFMVCNDVSVRDWQLRAPTATLGKSFDTHGPTGPWLTLAEEIGDPERLSVRTWVNGELRQNGNTSDFIYTLGQMLEELTTVMTLEPGDILTTGSPGGVGAAMVPPRYLKIGDSIRIDIEGLGAIENKVVAEPAPESL
jgi:2-keto-4-pentenoate hydratase/2-oxohepta-3-ene-1,7-dioic acid hydratase in catechol pathway